MLHVMATYEYLKVSGCMNAVFYVNFLLGFTLFSEFFSGTSLMCAIVVAELYARCKMM